MKPVQVADQGDEQGEEENSDGKPPGPTLRHVAMRRDGKANGETSLERDGHRVILGAPRAYKSIGENYTNPDPNGGKIMEKLQIKSQMKMGYEIHGLS